MNDEHYLDPYIIRADELRSHKHQIQGVAGQWQTIESISVEPAQSGATYLVARAPGMTWTFLSNNRLVVVRDVPVDPLASSSEGAEKEDVAVMDEILWKTRVQALSFAIQSGIIRSSDKIGVDLHVVADNPGQLIDLAKEFEKYMLELPEEDTQESDSMTSSESVGPDGQAIVILPKELETIDLTNAEDVLVQTPHTANMQGLLLAAQCPDGELLCKKDTPYPDGLGGVGTKDALVWFQKSVGLSPTAICDLKTWAALILATSA